MSMGSTADIIWREDKARRGYEQRKAEFALAGPPKGATARAALSILEQERRAA